MNLPNLTPGQAIQQSLQSAARAGRYPGGSGSGSGAGYGDGNSQFSNLEPNFSTEGPIILSDTLGVDFGPYLSRIIYIVRRNWYSVIPNLRGWAKKAGWALSSRSSKTAPFPNCDWSPRQAPTRLTVRLLQASTLPSPSRPCRKNSPATIWFCSLSSSTT